MSATAGGTVEPRVLMTDVKGEGEPLVLVPGALTGWLSWIPHQEQLAADYRVIRVQPIHNELGTRGERGDPTYTTETEREALRLTLDALRLEDSHFAGWSGGGRALIEFALAYPERVRSLTLVEPAAYWILEQLGESASEADELNSFMHGLAGREVSEDDLARFLRVAGFLRPGEDPRDHPNWERWLPHRMALSWQSEALDRSGRSIAELGLISAPTLLVRGTVTVEWEKRVVAELAERLPNASVLELEGDHACHIQQLDEFLGGLRSHLAAVDRAD